MIEKKDRLLMCLNTNNWKKKQNSKSFLLTHHEILTETYSLYKDEIQKTLMKY